MKGIVVGVQVIDFTPQGKDPVDGMKVHVNYEERGVDGYASGSIFINDEELIEDFHLGDAVNVHYARSGKKLGEIYGVKPRPRVKSANQNAQPQAAQNFKMGSKQASQ